VGPVLGLIILAVILVACHRWRPKYRPLHAAFSATTFGIVFLVAGTIGYTIKKSNWTLVSGTWSDGVVWWEIVYGVVALVFAVYFWRKGLQLTT
jgi:multisubunit Na+/H+ antiporter MnhG subunit